MSVSDLKIDGLNHPLRTAPHKGTPIKKTQASFIEAFKDADLETKHLHLRNENTPAKEQILELIGHLERHMNQRLLHAITSYDKSADDELRLQLDFYSLRLHTVEPSKGVTSRHLKSTTKFYSSNNLPINQNNDVFKVKSDLEDIIKRAAEKHDVEPALIKSLIKVESNFNPSSTSPKGAMGLMQLMPATAKDLGVTNAYDPVENVLAGTQYLKMLLERYDGNIDKALAAYNWGMGNIDKRPEKMPEETRNYVEKVNRYYDLAKA